MNNKIAILKELGDMFKCAVDNNTIVTGSSGCEGDRVIQISVELAEKLAERCLALSEECEDCNG